MVCCKYCLNIAAYKDALGRETFVVILIISVNILKTRSMGHTFKRIFDCAQRFDLKFSTGRLLGK